MKNGVIIINKEPGISSFAVVNKVKRLLGVKKAGHTGTLDPMATGVLPVLVGRAVKASEFMLEGDKHYIATMLLGITTDTEDITGAVLSESSLIPSEEDVFAAINSMVGESMQTPPMYSAIKVGGQKLYELARRGETVERAARKITIYSIDAKKQSEKEYILDIKCSKGTYIRTVCADIGTKLGVGAVMKTLERASAAGFSLEQATTLQELSEMPIEQIEAKIIPTEKIFSSFKKVVLPAFFSRLARCGLEIYLQKINFEAEIGERVTLFDEKGFFAIGEVREFDNGKAIKPIRQFDVD